MNTYSFTADEKKIKEINDYFNGRLSTNEKNQYIRYIFKANEATITVYTSNKVVISGKEAEMYYDMFYVDTEKLATIVIPQAGSDEVGTGDFFGPICVCATYVDEDVYQKIAQLKLDDSKKLTDQYILEVAPKLMNVVPHSLLVLPNSKYNQVITNNNMNVIKAKMHNQCYLHLINKGYKLPQLIVIDQFCPEDSYYNHLKGLEAVKGIHFETKAESKYISVAIGSMISRYAFLKEMEAMGEKYNCVFPKGAGSQVDSFAKEFVDKNGYQALYSVAKNEL